MVRLRFEQVKTRFCSKMLDVWNAGLSGHWCTNGGRAKHKSTNGRPCALPSTQSRSCVLKRIPRCDNKRQQTTTNDTKRHVTSRHFASLQFTSQDLTQSAQFDGDRSRQLVAIQVEFSEGRSELRKDRTRDLSGQLVVR
mmetsp:Transcript_22342/g.62150  ORF Transcript_22342/g.62150 Transcript_22342/m.62150 type:complete len:139 (-) Transcript_22342:642-1058(-)